MSGFEIAGLVLGAFPIFCEAVSGLRGVFSDLKTWWRFETEFEDLVSAIEREHIAFSQNIEIFLALLPIDDEIKERLLDGQDRDLWFRPDIQAELRRAIQPRYYTWFVREMDSIRIALDELHRRLWIQDGVFVFTPEVSRGKNREDVLERELLRLRVSFSHDKDRLLARVKDKNDALFAFLDRASHITLGTDSSSNTTKRSSNSKMVQPVLAFQRYGSALWRSLQNKWSCDCPGHHPFALAIEEHNSGRTDYPTLCFELLVSKNTDMRVRVIPRETPKNPPQTANARPPQLETITGLRTKLTVGNHLRKLNWKGKKTVQALVVSTSAIQTAEDRKDPCTDEVTWPLSISSLSVRKLFQHSRKPSSGSSTGSATPSPNQVTGYASLRSSKSTPATSSEARRVKFDDGGGSPGNQPGTAHVTSPEGRDAIKNLCDVLDDTILETRKQLGYLSPDHTTQLWLHAYPPSNLTMGDMTKLDIFITETASRESRMRASLSMLMTLLVLGPTQWFSPEQRRDRRMTGEFLRTGITNPVSSTTTVFLSFYSPAEVALDSVPQPGSLVRRLTMPSADTTRNMLFNMGVFLLELLYGDKLENQPWREEYLGSTVTRTANETTDLCTALRWQKRAEEEFGYGIADAIRRCILCSFDGAPDLENRAFLQAVCEGVVKPVENFLAAWTRGV